MNYLFTYLLFINLADYVATGLYVNKMGFDAESNPILHSLMVHAHTADVILYFKLIAFGLLAFSLNLLYRKRPDRYNAFDWRFIILGVNLGLTGVVFKSLYVYYTT